MAKFKAGDRVCVRDARARRYNWWTEGKTYEVEEDAEGWLFVKNDEGCEYTLINFDDFYLAPVPELEPDADPEAREAFEAWYDALPPNAPEREHPTFLPAAWLAAWNGRPDNAAAQIAALEAKLVARDVEIAAWQKSHFDNADRDAQVAALTAANETMREAINYAIALGFEGIDWLKDWNEGDPDAEAALAQASGGEADHE